MKKIKRKIKKIQSTLDSLIKGVRATQKFCGMQEPANELEMKFKFHSSRMDQLEAMIENVNAGVSVLQEQYQEVLNNAQT